MKTNIDETVEFLTQILEDIQLEMNRPCYPYTGRVHSALAEGKAAIYNALVEVVEYKTQKECSGK